MTSKKNDDNALLLLYNKERLERSDGQPKLSYSRSRLWIIHPDGSADRLKFSINEEVAYPGIRALLERELYPYKETDIDTYYKRRMHYGLHAQAGKYYDLPGKLEIKHYTPEEFASETTERIFDKAIVREVPVETAEAILAQAHEDTERDDLLFSFSAHMVGTERTHSCLDYQLVLLKSNGVSMIPNYDKFASNEDIHKHFCEQHLHDFPLTEQEQQLWDQHAWKELYNNVSARIEAEAPGLDLSQYNPLGFSDTLPQGEFFYLTHMNEALDALKRQDQSISLPVGDDVVATPTVDHAVVIDNNGHFGKATGAVNLRHMLEAIRQANLFVGPDSVDTPEARNTNNLAVVGDTIQTTNRLSA